MNNYNYEETFGKLYDGVNVIYIGIESQSEMVIVKFNKKCIMIGNFWDFHNGCCGLYNIPDFKGYNQLVALIQSYCAKHAKRVQVVRDLEWKYE